MKVEASERKGYGLGSGTTSQGVRGCLQARRRGSSAFKSPKRSIAVSADWMRKKEVAPLHPSAFFEGRIGVWFDGVRVGVLQKVADHPTRIEPD